jgi:hypothetical protein
MVKRQGLPVDDTINPCLSFGDHDEFWGRKHGTTGFNAPLICLHDGDVPVSQ